MRNFLIMAGLMILLTPSASADNRLRCADGKTSIDILYEKTVVGQNRTTGEFGWKRARVKFMTAFAITQRVECRRDRGYTFSQMLKHKLYQKAGPNRKYQTIEKLFPHRFGPDRLFYLKRKHAQKRN